jgi:hypothetical protein
MINNFHTPPHKSYLRAITLRGLETTVEGDPAFQGKNGSQPNN